jgi:precorrin-6B methylase 2
MSEEIENALKKKKDIMKDIQALVMSGTSRIDAIIHYCEKNNIEPEVVADAIKNNMKLIADIRLEAEELNYLPKIPRLPIAND